MDSGSESDIDLNALIAAYGKLTQSPEPYEQVVGSLCVSGILAKHLARPTDQEIGQLLVEYVSNELTMFSPEAAICEEAAKRMFRAVEESTFEVASIPKEKVNR